MQRFAYIGSTKMASDAVRFIRKGGRVIPIRAPSGGGKTAKGKIAPRTALKYGSTAVALAGGVISAASLGMGKFGLIGGHALGYGLDAASTSMAVAAHAGHGNAKLRVKETFKTELLNQAVGWGSFFGIAAALPSSRRAVVSGAKKVMSIRKAEVAEQKLMGMITFARRALGVIE
jgi:hypothetical protein